MVSKRQLEQQLAQARAELAEALERNRPDNDPEAFKVHTFSNERHSIATWQEAAEEYRKQHGDFPVPDPIPNPVQRPKEWYDFTYGNVTREDVTRNEHRRLTRAFERWVEDGKWTARERFFRLLAEFGGSQLNFNWRAFKNLYNSLH